MKQLQTLWFLKEHLAVDLTPDITTTVAQGQLRDEGCKSILRNSNIWFCTQQAYLRNEA
jgi:hypothetical protein